LALKLNALSGDFQGPAAALFHAGGLNRLLALSLKWLDLKLLS
jgi:hypothetical protein